MREPTFFILASLMSGPLHGYGIIKRAAEISEDRIHLTAGTLYGALERLESQGLVAAQGEEVVDGRARRYYRLTSPGERALAAEADRMQQAAGVVRTGLTALRGSTA